MKKLLLLITIMVTGLLFANAQSPNSFNYQTVVRDNSGDLITNQNVSFQISILKGSESGDAVFRERHFETTNAYGLVNLVIGTGDNVLGSISTIDWGADEYHMQIELDESGGTTFTNMGTIQLLSVPYSLYANRAKEVDIETDPEFSSSIAGGITESDTSNWNNKLDVEVDGSVTNELQTLTISNDTIYLTNGSYVKIPEKYWTYESNTITYSEGVHVGSTSSNAQTALYVEGSTDVSGSTTMILKRSNTRHNMISFQNLDNTEMSSIGLLAYSPRLSLTTFKEGTWYNSVQIELGAPSDALYIRENGNIGFGTSTPRSKLELSNGDIYFPNFAYGVILSSPDGKCFRVTVDNSGNLQTTEITAPSF